MRITAIFLLFISLAAVFTPCCEFDDCLEDSAAGSNEQKGYEGSCSPFSSCSTCCAAVVLTRSIHVEEAVGKNDASFPTELLLYFSSYYPAFWQPPRLA